MTITTKISARILILVQSGKSLQEAFDAVLGAGSYAKMASDLYEAMNGAGA